MIQFTYTVTEHSTYGQPPKYTLTSDDYRNPTKWDRIDIHGPNFSIFKFTGTLMGTIQDIIRVKTTDNKTNLEIYLHVD